MGPNGPFLSGDRDFSVVKRNYEGEGGDQLSVQFYVHSDYSLLQSALTIERLVKRAEQLGIEMLALTDYNTTAGHYEFQERCKRAGIKPILGLELSVQYQDAKEAPVVLIAVTQLGYENLLRLASLPVPISYANLVEFKGGLALLEGVGTTPMGELLAAGRLEDAMRLDAWYKKQFGPWYYLRWQVGEREDLVNHFPDNQFILCQDVRYAQPQAREILEVMAQIGRIEPVIPPHPMLGWEELQEKFTGPERVVEQTLQLAKACDVQLRGEQVLPPHPSGQNLRDLAFEGARERYGEVTEAVRARLVEELTVIEELGFADYFLIVADIVRSAKEAQIPVGPGRGSAAGSLVAYCLGITEVDPLRWGLLFERFLNKARASRPDVDLDFCYERRGEVLAYVAERFGQEHVAQIGTYGTFSRRSAAQEIRRVLGEDKPALTAQMDGLKRNRSTHAAGVIVTAQPVQSISAVYSDRGMPVTHLDMYSLEALGVLKIDLLGLRTLTLLRRMEEAVKRRESGFSLAAIPLEDRKAFELLGEGKTLGIFQLESELFRDLLRSLQPKSFADLVAMLALGRPGPLKMFPTYLENRKNPEKVKYIHDSLADILDDTYGLILYQEQLMQIAHRLAGFTLGEADLFRRDLAKQDRQAVEAWREKFCTNAVRCGLNSRQAEQLFQMTIRYSGYAFNKAHSVSYALLTWQMSYLKANYPSEFFLTLLSEARPGEQQSRLLLECISCGVSVLPPSVVYSELDSVREGDSLRLGLTSIQGLGRFNGEKIVAARKRGIWPNFAAFRRSVQLERDVLRTLITAGACEQFGPRPTLLRELGDPIPTALELLEQERNLLGAYLSRHPAAAFLPLVQHFRADSEVVVGEVIGPGHLDTPQGIVVFQAGRGAHPPQQGQRVALFGRNTQGVFQVEWVFRLGPVLLASPQPEQLEKLKGILLQQGQGRRDRAYPVVLRFSDGTFHLLPAEFSVTDPPHLEGQLEEAGIVFTWFDPWKEAHA